MWIFSESTYLQARETVQLMLDIQQRDRETIIEKFGAITKNTEEQLQVRNLLSSRDL